MQTADLPGWADTLVLPGPDQGRSRGGWDLSATRAGAVLLARGDVVVKVHRAGTTATGLGHRLRLLTDPRVAQCWAPLLVPEPLELPVQAMPGRRVASVWGRLRPLDPRTADPPWAQAACLLARLHAVLATPDTPPPDGSRRVPQQGGPARLHRAVRRLEARPRSPASTIVLRAARSVEAELDGVPPASAAAGLVHGDWHLGQVGFSGGGSAGGALRLMDPDDLGFGDPAWDLARPAGFWAAGVLTDDDWQTFLGAYRDAGGRAVPPLGDPWPHLDLAARAAVVVAAAAALEPDDGRAAGSDEHDGGEGGKVDEGGKGDEGGEGGEGGEDESAEALIEACARIANAG